MILFLIKYVLIQPFKGLLYPRERQRQVHADVPRPVEGAAILPEDTDFETGALDVVQGKVMGFAVRFTVQEQHIGGLGSGYVDVRPVLLDEVTGEVRIFREDGFQLVHPLIAFRLVCAQQGVHGHQVHAVVVA